MNQVKEFQDNPNEVQPDNNEENQVLSGSSMDDIVTAEPYITLQTNSYDHKEVFKALVLKVIDDNPHKGVYEIAKMLGMGKSSLYRHIYKLGIDIPKQGLNKPKYQSNRPQ